MPNIQRLAALEILDSRGRPTILATCELTGGIHATASIPSGASTGKAEALELRDGDPKRYRGLGCRKAISHICGELNQQLAEKTFSNQRKLDQAMINIDNTPNKSRLGANALLAVSLSFARASAAEKRVPLYLYFAEMLGQPLRTLPRPTINLFSGGKHAGGQVEIQDVLVVPASARTMDEALAMAYEVYQSAVQRIHDKYDMRPLTADEGGLAPPFPSVEAMFEDAVESIRAAGFRLGSEVALAVDIASSHFYRDGTYHLGNTGLRSSEMVELLCRWLDNYPIVSIEDGLAEEDWQYWPQLCAKVGGRALVLGDDFLCTNPSRITRAIETHSANALLLKVNQIGTLTEAAEAYKLARAAGWLITMSARSGETEDNWLADLAVGWSADQIKIGSMTHSERLAKYNRLLEIEAATQLPLVKWPRTPSSG